MSRGRSVYPDLEPLILDVLNESPVPLKILSINFIINEKTKKIISLNTLKAHIEDLVRRKKIVKKIDKDNNEYYWIKKRAK
ncbi:MAG: hypothetical protein DRP00_02635 [Candidatus Aenigmatarchaeota archaeon]|nr:MAG: hypothetical protein DRO65_02510 [Candidatus Altiarchaeales archaeon]RLI98135.1 MAG: hypothetical protein DRP00_02635 [Candidatus Aenigmarchaeota archaeon]